MREAFQSKHIQEMLGISVDRVTYLVNKIQITPEVEEVVGTGRAHLYSFKNALEFALAHHMNANGLPPGDVRRILDHLTKLDEQYSWEVFVPKKADQPDGLWDVTLGYFTLSYFGTGEKLSVYFSGGPIAWRERQLYQQAYKKAASMPKKKRKGTVKTKALSIHIGKLKQLRKQLNLSDADPIEEISDQEIRIGLNISVVRQKVLNYARA